MMKLNSLSFAITILVCLLSVSIKAQDSDIDQSSVFRITSINHDDYSIVINDNRYIMPISLDTYIFDSKNRKTIKTTRYSLKKGQVVFFKKSIKNRQAYVDQITIFRK